MEHDGVSLDSEPTVTPFRHPSTLTDALGPEKKSSFNRLGAK